MTICGPLWVWMVQVVPGAAIAWHVLIGCCGLKCVRVALAQLHRKSLKAARVAENGVKILRLLIGTAYDPTPRRAAQGAPYAVHFTLMFSAEVFPLFATSSYWTC